MIGQTLEEKHGDLHRNATMRKRLDEGRRRTWSATFFGSPTSQVFGMFLGDDVGMIHLTQPTVCRTSNLSQSKP